VGLFAVVHKLTQIYKAGKALKRSKLVRSTFRDSQIVKQLIWASLRTEGRFLVVVEAPEGLHNFSQGIPNHHIEIMGGDHT
jgi:hypothetical protein